MRHEDPAQLCRHHLIDVPPQQPARREAGQNAAVGQGLHLGPADAGAEGGDDRLGAGGWGGEGRAGGQAAGCRGEQQERAESEQELAAGSKTALNLHGLITWCASSTASYTIFWSGENFPLAGKVVVMSGRVV